MEGGRRQVVSPGGWLAVVASPALTMALMLLEVAAGGDVIFVRSCIVQ
jgi:hypothetical protein